MFAWSTEPGGGPAVLPSVCCAFGTAVVQPAGLRCRNVAGAPLLGCEFYPMYQFKSLRPSRQADSGNNSLPEVLAALFPQGDAFHILAEEWVEVCWVPTLEMLHCCLWAVGAPRCGDVGQPRAGGGQKAQSWRQSAPICGGAQRCFHCCADCKQPSWTARSWERTMCWCVHAFQNAIICLRKNSSLV